MGKADVGRGVQQHGLSGDGQGLHGRADAAKHAVFIADVRALQAGQAVARLLPAENAVKIFIRHGKITEVRKSETLMHRLEDRRPVRSSTVIKSYFIVPPAAAPFFGYAVWFIIPERQKFVNSGR